MIYVIVVVIIDFFNEIIIILLFECVNNLFEIFEMDNFFLFIFCYIVYELFDGLFGYY